MRHSWTPTRAIKESPTYSTPPSARRITRHFISIPPSCPLRANYLPRAQGWNFPKVARRLSDHHYRVRFFSAIFLFLNISSLVFIFVWDKNDFPFVVLHAHTHTHTTPQPQPQQHTTDILAIRRTADKYVASQRVLCFLSFPFPLKSFT